MGKTTDDEYALRYSDGLYTHDDGCATGNTLHVMTTTTRTL